MARVFNKKGCGFGCGAVFVVGIIVASTMITAMNRQYQSAADDRRALEEQFGARAEFDPGAGEVIPADRLEIFLLVRESLAGEFDKLHGANRMMLGPEGVLDTIPVPQPRIARLVSRAVGGANQLMHMGSFAGDRNRALRTHGMGFGEYTWIYALSYYGVLGVSPVLGRSPGEAGFMPPQAREDLAGMMGRRADALAGRGTVTDLVEAAVWRAEAARLADDSYAVPFPGGAPASLIEALADSRNRLAATFSYDSDPLELMRLKPMGLGYEDR